MRTLKILAMLWMLTALVACGQAAGGVTTALPTTPSPISAQQASPAQPSEASTCAAARETLLTGTEAEITVAMKALVADRSANAKARESAKAWLDTNNRDLKKMDATVVQMTCENAGA